MRKRLTNALIGLAVALVTTTLAAAEPFKIIVNVSNDTKTVARADLAKMFLKRAPRWSNGIAVVAADQSVGTPARDAFSSAVHRKSAAAVRSYWQQQIFAGRDVPPIELSSDADVIALVRTNPGAIGYVSASADTTGVKVLLIE